MPNISQQITDLLTIRENNKDIKYVCDDFSINWDVIKDLLDKKENLDDLVTCLKLKRIIDPVIVASHENVIKRDEEFKEILEAHSHWTYSVKEVKNIADKFCAQPDKYALTGFLEMTTILEFALGNVYETYFNRRSPHLLKDLLRELSTCPLFEAHQILILQILLGTSKGVNLRNLAWHGFLETLNPAYLSFLLLIIISYGKHLQDVTIRSKLRRPIELTLAISVQKENFKNILSLPTVQNCNYQAWQSIINFYKEKNFRSGIYLLLAQIENILRKIYGQINDVDIQADLNKYYIIMDSIFYGYVLSNDITPLAIGKITNIQEMEIRKTHKRNKLLDYFPRSIFYMHYDMFYAADGPRIRDKISHGEAVIENADDLFLTLLQFTTAVVEYYEKKNVVCDYETIYHSNVIFYRQFVNANVLTENFFNQLEIPKTLKCHQAEGFQKVPLNFTVEDVKIHFRPLIESQIIKIMLKILETYKISVTNFEESCNELFRLYAEHKLSSSRRNMLENLVTFLPNFSRGFNAILSLLLKIFSTVQNTNDDFEDDNWSKKILKMLKQTLQLTQVYQKHFSVDDRNYFVANSKTCEFISQIIDNNRLLFVSK